jgi:SecD/SecF fusion protein
LALLLFGGDTLKDFAFALIVGVASGAYSSIFIASPVLTHWKEREGVYRNRRARIVRDLGYVPAYATALGDTPIDVEPVKKSKRGRRAATLSDEPGEQLSKEEFDELVAEIGPELAEQQTAGRARAGVGTRRGRSAKTEVKQPDGLNGADAKSPPRDPAADLTPEDLVLKEDPDRGRKSRRPRNRRHGRAR